MRIRRKYGAAWSEEWVLLLPDGVRRIEQSPPIINASRVDGETLKRR